MHLSLIPPPYNNTKTNTCLPCSNYTCTYTLTRMCIMHFTKRLVNVKQRQTPLYFPLPLLLLFLSFYFWRGGGVGGYTLIGTVVVKQKETVQM